MSKSGSATSLFHLGGCGLLRGGMALTLVTGWSANLVCFFGLKVLFSGTSVSAM